MKKNQFIIIILFIVSLMSVSGATENKTPVSQKGNFEIGGTAGMPSGLNMRYWFINSFGIDILAGSTTGKDFYSTADFLYEDIHIYNSKNFSLKTFFGLGGLWGIEDKNYTYNLRLPIGLSMPFHKYPLTLSLYGAPAFVLGPKKKFDINWGIAARFNFTIASVNKLKNKQLNHEIGSIKKDYESIKNNLNKTQTDLDRAINALNKTRNELSSTKGKLGTSKNEMDKTISDLTKTKTELDKVKNNLSYTKGKLDTTKSELDKTRGKLDDAKGKLISAKIQLDTTKKKLDATKDQLYKTKKDLDERELEINNKQADLDRATNIIKNSLSGKEKEKAEKELKEKQKELNLKITKFNEQKKKWKKRKIGQTKERKELRAKCEARRGIIDANGYCACRKDERWNKDRSACICDKGFKLNNKTDSCEPCKIVTYRGYCTDSCSADEKLVTLKKGPNKYVCVKRCRRKNEFWSSRRKNCLCKDGFYRDSNGKCVPRR